MKIIKCDGWFLGVNQRDAVWFRPDTKEEKIFLEILVQTFRKAHPCVEEIREVDVHPST